MFKIKYVMWIGSSWIWICFLNTAIKEKKKGKKGKLDDTFVNCRCTTLLRRFLTVTFIFSFKKTPTDNQHIIWLFGGGNDTVVLWICNGISVKSLQPKKILNRN